MVKAMVLVGCVLACAGCSFYDYTLTAPNGSPPSAGRLTGEDCAPNFFGIGFGSMSVEAAMKAGGITTPSTIGFSHVSVLVLGQHCVTVTGEGPGPKSASR